MHDSLKFTDRNLLINNLPGSVISIPQFTFKFTQSCLESPLMTEAENNPLIILQTVDSTNRFALAWISSKTRPEGAPGLPEPGTAILALDQTAGRGQYGTTWWSEPGKSLTMSVINFPDFLPAREAFRLNVAMALGVMDTLREQAGAAWCLKWPNDVYAGDLKIAGILIENGVSRGNLTYSVFGFGLNVNQREFPPELPNPVSLFQLDGRDREIVALAQLLRGSLNARYEQLRLGAWASLKRQYLQLLCGYGELRRFKTPEKEFEGVIAGVEDSGELAVEAGGLLHRYRFKEIIQIF